VAASYVEPTAASSFRRRLAERIAPAYAARAGVAAVVLGGSAARGHADRYSDIELGVIWTEAPTEDARAGAISAAGGDLVLLYPLEDEVPGPVWSDAWKIGRQNGVPFTGIEVDMSHYVVETVEETLRDVLEAFDPDPMKQNLVGGLVHSIPLHGEAAVTAWQERASIYPQELRLAVVQAHAQIEGLWRLDAYCTRGNPVVGYRVLTAAHEDLLHVLLGLNRVYFTGFKSLDAVVSDLAITPPDLLERIRASYPLELETSRTVLTSLVEEMHDLVEEHLPELDIEWLREILGYERPLWDGDE
jgi:hypothetical protein